MDGLAAACRLRGPRRHHRAAVARPGQAPERSGLRRPGVVDRRVGHHRRAADGRPDARRPHAARLAPGHEPSGEFANWYRSMGVEQRFSGVAGFGYIEVVRERAARRLPARRAAPTTASRRLGVAGPGMADTLSELTVPGLDLCQLTNLLADTRDSGEFSAIVVTSSARPRDVRGRRAGLPRRRRARRTLDAAPQARRRAGSSASSTPSRSCASAVARADRRRGDARARARRRSRATASRPAPAPPSARCRRPCTAPRSRASARVAPRRPDDASACRSRPTAAGTSPSPAPSRTGMGDPEVQAALVLRRSGSRSACSRSC